MLSAAYLFMFGESEIVVALRQILHLVSERLEFGIPGLHQRDAQQRLIRLFGLRVVCVVAKPAVVTPRRVLKINFNS